MLDDQDMAQRFGNLPQVTKEADVPFFYGLVAPIVAA